RALCRGRLGFFARRLVALLLLCLRRLLFLPLGRLHFILALRRSGLTPRFRPSFLLLCWFLLRWFGIFPRLLGPRESGKEQEQPCNNASLESIHRFVSSRLISAVCNATGMSEKKWLNSDGGRRLRGCRGSLASQERI